MKSSNIILIVAGILCLLTILSILRISSSSSSRSMATKSDDQSDEDHQSSSAEVSIVASQKKKTNLVVTEHEHELHKTSSSSSSSFSIVILTYKAPKSLSETIKSLATTDIINHPDLAQIIVYFQAFDKSNDRKLVQELAEKYYSTLNTNKKKMKFNVNPEEETGEEDSFVRVVGREANLPVAKATFTALSYVKTPLVLYLECDRPAFDYFGNTNNNQNNKNFANSLISTAIKFVSSKRADVFRLQIYANDQLAIAENKNKQSSSTSLSSSSSILPKITYGQGPLSQNCERAPMLTRRECLQAKQAGGSNRVFYTAYCKHWSKLMNEKEQPQQDLCDAVCFTHWKDMIMKNASLGEEFGVAKTKFTKASSLSSLSENNNNDENENNEDVICTDSEWCNWTNQPTMYLKSWFEENIKKTCLSSPKNCVGVPGRKSAVLQEIFFVKNRDAWKNRKHKICLHKKGLFYHFEIDNREK